MADVFLPLSSSRITVAHAKIITLEMWGSVNIWKSAVQ